MRYRFYTRSRGEIAEVSMRRECTNDIEAFLITAQLATHDTGAEARQGSALICRVPPKARPLPTRMPLARSAVMTHSRVLTH